MKTRLRIVLLVVLLFPGILFAQGNRPSFLCDDDLKPLLGASHDTPVPFGKESCADAFSVRDRGELREVEFYASKGSRAVVLPESKADRRHDGPDSDDSTRVGRNNQRASRRMDIVQCYVYFVCQWQSDLDLPARTCAATAGAAAAGRA